MAGRRGQRDFGAVRKLASGRWQARYPDNTGQLVPAPQRFATKKEAAEWLDGVRTDKNRGSFVDPRAGQVQLDTFARQVIENRVLSPRTKEEYDGLLARHISPTFGQVELGQLSLSAIRGWHTRLAHEHPITAAKAYRLLSMICKAAVEEDKLLRSPCRISGAGVEKSPERPTISQPELQALSAAMPGHLRLLVQLAAWCALRRGELLGLRRRNVDVLRGGVHIERATTKTDAGARFVHWPPNITASVEDHLARFVGPGADALVFTGDKGGPLYPAQLYKAWDKARRKIGRPELHLHDLRHAGATWAAIAGATTKELMARIGHSSHAAALRYQHAAEDRDAAVAAALAQPVETAPVVAMAAQDGTRMARRGSAAKREHSRQRR